MTTASRFLPWLAILGVGSGCAALMYLIVWFQMLQLGLGSTTSSSVVLLATFLAGLCAGTLGFQRRHTHLQPLRLYAYLQGAIAIWGLLALFIVPLFGASYFAAICLLPPAILMGASLPGASRWIESTRGGASWRGVFYGCNAVGAGVGCLLAEFYTLRVYDQYTTIFVAAGISAAVGATAWWLSSSNTPVQVQATDAEEVEPDFSPATILWTTGLAGAAALGAAIVWTRIFGILMGSTTYVFSITVAALLIGLGLGSAAGAWVGRIAPPRLALGWCQMLMPVAMGWSCYTLSGSMPYWPVNPFLATSPWFSAQIDMARVLWTVLPPAITWGASAALALAASRSVGAVFVANAGGAIVGALTISLFVVPRMGTDYAQSIAILLAGIGALTALGPYVRRYNANAFGAGLSASVMLAIWLATQVSAVPGEFIAYGRQMATMLGQSQVVSKAEGINSSVAVTTWAANQVYLNVNGHVQATTEIYDMALQRMLAHLPGMLHPNPKSVLVIGFGAGVSAGSFTRYPSVEHITITEVEPEIPAASKKYFAKQNYDVASNPKTTVVSEDGRRFLTTTEQKFDIIASDPSDVFAKGTAGLHTQEYFELVKAHLNPGGYFTLYMPLYESDGLSVQNQLATFFSVFPNATVWANTREGAGYDMVVLGQTGPLKINLDEVQSRLDRDDYRQVRESLIEIGFFDAASLFKTYAGRQRDLGRWFADTEVTTDRNLRLTYQAGWAINSYAADPLYREILQYRQAPRDMFAGNQDTIEDIISVFTGVPRTPATTLLPSPTSNASQPPR